MSLKKTTSILLCVLLVTGLLAGCGSENKTGPQVSKDKQITLTYGYWSTTQEPTLRKLVDGFEKLHKNVKIKMELTPNKQYWTKLETAATGGTLPDVFWMNGPNIVKYADGGILMPIDDMVKKDKFDFSNYPEALVNLYTVNGKHYAIPKDWDVCALWYNKEIFDNAKVPYPDKTWTWDKLREVAKKLTDKSKGIYGTAAHMDAQPGYYNTILQAGGFVISNDRKVSGYDKPETIAGVQFWINLLHDGSSPTFQQLTDNSSDAIFESGKLAMIYMTSDYLPDFTKNDLIKDKIDIAEMPIGQKRGTVIHGLGNVIYAKTKHPDMAWEFVKYLGGKEANDIVAESGTVIPAYKPSLPKYVDYNKGYNVQAFVNALDYASMYPSSKDTSKWSKLETEYFKKVWAGQMSTEDACKGLAQDMNKILQAEGN